MFRTNSASFLTRIKQEPKKVERKLLTIVRKSIKYAHQSITSKTPVFTGTALSNYVWSTGSPSSSFSGDPGGGPTGQTNRMALGSEPRRPSAQAKADASRDAVLLTLDPFQKFFLTNNTPHIMGLEYGRFPLPPLNQRSPNGMYRVTLAALKARLASGAL